MKLVIVLFVTLGCMVSIIAGKNFPFSSTLLVQKKDQKVFILCKESQSDRFGVVRFNHENHSTKRYSFDGKTVISCVECHHTDQPFASLKPPLKTSERNVVLSAASLLSKDAAPVKSCGACHLQKGDDSAPIPTIEPDGALDPTILTNDIAFHIKCDVCHDRAIAARPALKGKVPGTKDCFPCHKPIR